MATTSDCPATHYIDSDDWAEPLSCDLPIEHNSDDEPWHASGWDADGERTHVEWRWDKESLVTRWPPARDADPLRSEFVKRLLTNVLDTNRLFDRIPVAARPSTGTTIAFRKWGALEPNPNYRYSDEPPVVNEPNPV